MGFHSHGASPFILMGQKYVKNVEYFDKSLGEVREKIQQTSSEGDGCCEPLKAVKSAKKFLTIAEKKTMQEWQL